MGPLVNVFLLSLGTPHYVLKIGDVGIIIRHIFMMVSEKHTSSRHFSDVPIFGNIHIPKEGCSTISLSEKEKTNGASRKY